MDYGLRISLPGYDVKTCTDDQLVLSSKFPCLKIIDSAEIPFQFNLNRSFAIGHSMPFPFIPLLFYYDPDVSAYRQVTDFSFDTTTIYWDYYATSANTSITNLIYFLLYG